MRELDTSITLSVPLDENDELHACFKHLDEFVESQNLYPNKKHNKFIEQKNDQHFLNVKMYIASDTLIRGGPNPKPKDALMHFYNYLNEGTEMRFIFSIGDMHEIDGEHGFPSLHAESNLKNRLGAQ